MNNNYKDLPNILQSIISSNTIVITAHTNPDGDAIGSTFALTTALLEIGKKPIVILEEFSSRYDIIPNIDLVYKGSIDGIVPDLFISMDCGDIDRFTDEAKQLFGIAKVTCNIDHHASNCSFADYNIVDTSASSTSEITYAVVCDLVPFSKDIASCIYAGIVYDSGGFRHGTTSSYTHMIAQKAHDLGIDFNTIYNNINGMHTVLEIEAFKIAVNNICIDNENHIISSFVTQDELKLVGATYKDLSMVISFLISTYQMETAILAYEKKFDEVKISMRSKDTDVNKVANIYGGGGHVHASGCTLYGDIHESLSKVIASVKEEQSRYGQ